MAFLNPALLLLGQPREHEVRTKIIFAAIVLNMGSIAPEFAAYFVVNGEYDFTMTWNMTHVPASA